MTTTGRLLVMAVALLLAGCGGKASGNPDAPRKNAMVQFTDIVVSPKVVHLTEGGNLVWINMSTLYRGSVVFPPGIKQSFTCSELRPLFMEIAEGGYQSIPIERGQPESVTLPCPLKPGSYDYEIYLFSGTLPDPAAGMDNPQQTLKGQIVVEPK